MKSTVVDESLSYYKTNVLFQRILQDFKTNHIDARKANKEKCKSCTYCRVSHKVWSSPVKQAV